MIVRLLLALNEPAWERRLRELVRSQDVIMESASGPEHLWEKVSRENFDIVIVGRRIIGSQASETVASLRSLPDTPDVVVVCEREDPRERAELLGAGCMSVLHSELPDVVLQEALTALLQRRLARVEQLLAPQEAARHPQLSDFNSACPAMETFMYVVQRVVASDATLLIMGETGVGKERLARAIHAESPRSAGPFISVNCGALSESLLESELFGHEEGAFTGAHRPRRGWFELAHNGTIFLDEIGEMPKHLQVKLLSVLQRREVQRVGAEATLAIDVRVIAATNRDLVQEVESGAFRRDLFYRLGVVSLTIPPLRERREDIPNLYHAMIEGFRSDIRHQIHGVSAAAREALCKYSWPGNVRELMNVIERAMLLSRSDEISLEDLPENISRLVSPREESAAPHDQEGDELRIPSRWLQLPLREARENLLVQFERAYLSSLLEATGGKIGETARLAGIQPRSLFEKMRRHKLKKEDFRRRRK